MFVPLSPNFAFLPEVCHEKAFLFLLAEAFRGGTGALFMFVIVL
jgi:hypothetical protein